MKTFNQITEIVNNIQYKNWKFRIMQKGDGYLLQVIFNSLCVKTGKLEEQRCRKWYISAYSCTSEIVRTAFKAVEAAELHELYENFNYKGSRLFDPHLNVDVMANQINEGKLIEEIRA